jgi:hypothetical protein
MHFIYSIENIKNNYLVSIQTIIHKYQIKLKQLFNIEIENE